MLTGGLAGRAAPSRTAVEMPQLFEVGRDIISFAGGLPDLTQLPVGDLAGQLSRLVRLGGRTLLQYSTPQLAPRLVPAVADLMARESVVVPAEQLIPTAGSQMGLVLAALALGTPGESVLCESPLYPGASAAFRSAGLRPHAVRADAEGLLPESIRETVHQVRRGGGTARLLYTNPTFANPTGVTMSEARRVQVLQVCRSLDLMVIEDNPYGLLAFDGRCVPALASLDPDHVVYLGTFSKVFAPGLRSGWIAAPAALAPQLRSTAEVLTLSPSAFVSATLAAFYAAQGWSALLTAYQRAYAERCAVMEDALRTVLGPDSGWSWRRPGGGFYLWLQHRGDVDTAALAARAAEQGVSFVPGRHFGVDGEFGSCLRLAFSYPPHDQIVQGIGRLGPVLAAADQDARAAA